MREDYLRHATEVGRRLGDKKIRAGFVQALTPETRYLLCREVVRANRADREAAWDAAQERVSAAKPGAHKWAELARCWRCQHPMAAHVGDASCTAAFLRADGRKLEWCTCDQPLPAQLVALRSPSPVPHP